MTPQDKAHIKKLRLVYNKSAMEAEAARMALIKADDLYEKKRIKLHEAHTELMDAEFVFLDTSGR